MKRENINILLMLALVALIYAMGYYRKDFISNTPKPKVDSLKLIKRAFIDGWERGSTVQMEQITIHGNTVKAERAVNNIFALDTNNFGKEK